MSDTISAPPKVMTRDSPRGESPVASRSASPSRASSYFDRSNSFPPTPHYDNSGIATPVSGASRSTSRSKDPLLKRPYGQRNASVRFVNSLLSKLQGLSTAHDQPVRGRTTLRAIEENDTGMPSESIETEAQDKADDAKRSPKRRRIKLSKTMAQRIVGFAMISLVGLNDSATGANLDSMKEHYQVSYNVISTVFLSNIAGYFISAVSASFLTHHLGLNKTLLVAAAFMAGGCLTMALVPPFPVFVLALALLGFGGGVYDASLTSVVAHDEDAGTMALLYAMFGVGAVIASLSVGALLDRNVPWNYYYLIPTALSCILAILGVLVFRSYELPADEPGETLQMATVQSMTTEDDKVVHARSRISVQTRMKRTLSMKSVWVGFLLIIVAFGTGDTLSAWMVSFMVEKRQSPAAASRYQLAGLWGGIALGRVVLGFVGTRVPEKTFSLTLLVLTSACLAIVWAVRQYIVGAVFLCIAGFFLGPITPRVLSAVSARVPPSLKSTAMSLTIGLGLIGSGAGPLLFGFVAGHGWLGSLPAVLIVTCAIGCGGWLILPKNNRRDD